MTQPPTACLEVIWKVSVGCLEGVCRGYGGCLKGIRSELLLWRYLQNNIDFLKIFIFNVISIFSQFCTSEVFKDGSFLIDYGILWRLDIKMSQKDTYPRLLSSPNTKLEPKVNHYLTPCISSNLSINMTYFLIYLL